MHLERPSGGLLIMQLFVEYRPYGRLNARQIPCICGRSNPSGCDYGKGRQFYAQRRI